MADADLVVVHSFGSRPEADIAVSALDAAGIDAVIQADTGGGMRPHLAWAGVGFRILVREEDLTEAREILELPRKAELMSVDDRITDYDRIADRFDIRYHQYSYDGVRETLLNFLGPQPSAALEVGCGTGYWLGVSSGRGFLAGVEPSSRMLERARAAAPEARLVRARAEELPWRDESFDRIFCVNALHHFTDRSRFFTEARRVLKPGGGLLTIGKDPHTDRDDWWVYELFEETRAIDRDRFARVRTLRGEMALAGFAWTESMEADHIEVMRPASEALRDGIVNPGFTSQLTVLSEDEYKRGVERLRQALDAAAGELQLVADFRLYATIAWV